MKKVSLILLSLFVCSTTKASREGHGGIVYICGQGDRSTIELLDFKEGRDRLGLSYSDDSTLSVQEHLDRALFRLNEIQGSGEVLGLIKAELEWFQNDLNLVFTEGDQYLVNPKDYTTPVVQEEGCQYHTLGYMLNEYILRIDSKIYRRLNSLQKAGFLLHEAAGVVSRMKTGAKYTDETRLFVALIMSESARSERIDLLESYQRAFRPDFAKTMANNLTVALNYTLPKRKKLRKSIGDVISFEISVPSGRGEVAFWKKAIDSIHFADGGAVSAALIEKPAGQSHNKRGIYRAWVKSESGHFKYRLLKNGRAVREGEVHFLPVTTPEGGANEYYRFNFKIEGLIPNNKSKDIKTPNSILEIGIEQ